MNKGNVVISASGNGHSAIATWWIIGVIGAVIGVVVGCCVENSMSGSYPMTQHSAHNIWIGAGIFFAVLCLVMAHVVQSRIGKTVINVYESDVEGIGVTPKFPLSFMLWGSISSLRLVAFKYAYNENFSIDAVNGNTVVINASGVQHKVYAMNAVKIRDTIVSQKNEFATVNEWIEMNKKLLRGNANDLTMALMAVTHGRVDVMKLLVARGLPIGMKDEKGETLMHFAAFGGNLEVMKWLRNAHRLNINEASKNGDLPICIAAGCGHIAVVKWLLDCGVDVNSKGQRGRTPMHQAVLNGRIEMMSYLNENYDVNISLRTDDGMSLMESAISNNRTDSIECLVKMDVDLEDKNADGRTALFGAAKAGQVDSIRALEKLGAKLEAKDNDGSTPMFIAAQAGRVDSIKQLAALGADVNARNNYGCTPIFVASGSGQIDCIECLEKLGAKVNARDMADATPIFPAVFEGQVASIKCLASLGTDINAKAKNGMTAMALAAKAGQTACEECLRELGAR